MAQRDSVYLYLFVVAIVLFLGATFAFLLSYNKNEGLRKEAAQARQDVRDLEESNRALADEVAALKTLIAGESGASGVGSDESARQEFLDREFEKIQTPINAAMEDLGRAELAFSYLVEPYEQVGGLLQSYRKQRDDARTEEESALQELETTTDAKDEVIAGLQQDISDLNAQLAEAIRRYEDCENLRETDREDFSRRLANCQDELADAEILASRQLQMRDNEIETLRSRLERMESEVREQQEFAELEPDGRLFKVAPSLEKGWIDLGRKDHLMNGTVFRVFQIVKGGKKVDKGRVEVRKVDEEMAEVRILDEVDPVENPITDGDRIASPFYDVDKRPTFVLAGSELQSKAVTVEFLKARLANYGVDLVEDVDINTSFVVALQGYQRTEQYNRARSLGVPLLREEDVLDFIGY